MMKPRPERLKARAEKKMTKAQTLYGKAEKIMKAGPPRDPIPENRRGYGVMSSPPTAKDLALNKANDLYRRSAQKEKKAKTLMAKSKALTAKKSNNQKNK